MTSHVIALCSHIRSRKTHCAAFCAPLVLVTGSVNDAGCNGGENGGLLKGYARMSPGWFIYTWASMNISGITLLREQGSPCLLRGSLAYNYIQCRAYMDAICKERLSKKYSEWSTVQGVIARISRGITPTFFLLQFLAHFTLLYFLVFNCFL